MECNKDEAIRAKEIAEKKFMEMDISGAKRFALKAQNLYSRLDGLPQLLATFDVYISAEKKNRGDVDWYSVLGVEPLADDDTIRRQYKKLALLLHPDRNKSVGADGAFKILLEAWCFLSDKAKRIAYDKKRNLMAIYDKIPTGKPAVPADPNGFHNLAKGQRDQKSTMHPKPAVPPPYPFKLNTFWTTCDACKMQFEYLQTFLNHNLLCQNCRQPFVAVETPPPPINGNSYAAPWATYLQQRDSFKHTSNKISHGPGRKLPSATNLGRAGFSDVGSLKKTFHSGTYSNVGSIAVPAFFPAQAAGGVKPAFEQLKRTREELQTAVKREEVVQWKSQAKKTGAGLSIGSYSNCPSSVLNLDRVRKKRRKDGRGGENQMAMGNGVCVGGVPGSKRCSFETRVNVAGNSKRNSTRELSQLEIRNLLMEKTKREIHSKLNEWSSGAASKTSDKGVKEKEEGKQKVALIGVKAVAYKCWEFVDTKKEVHTKKSSPVNSDVHSDTESADPVSMTVPDPDFHDFDEDRTEKLFNDNQVWAAYDNDDGMPRYYAMIHSVISRKPFKIRISWLNSKRNNELGSLNWIGSGFFKTSGDFWIGKREIYKSLNSFSHKVNWTKGTRGAIRIYPKKGDVWALYRNWSTDWNEFTPDEVIHKYDMVEVIEDYNEECGVAVAPLVKVSGFKTLFKQHLNPKEVRTIPREEMFRFSHQVPSYFLTGQEGQNAPKGCWELDPASMPLELLQVMEDEMIDTVGKAEEEDLLGGVNSLIEEEVVMNSRSTKEIGTAEDAREQVVAEVRMKGEETKEVNTLVYHRRHQKIKKEKRLAGVV